MEIQPAAFLYTRIPRTMCKPALQASEQNAYGLPHVAHTVGIHWHVHLHQTLGLWASSLAHMEVHDRPVTRARPLIEGHATNAPMAYTPFATRFPHAPHQVRFPGVFNTVHATAARGIMTNQPTSFAGIMDGARCGRVDGGDDKCPAHFSVAFRRRIALS